MPPKTHTLKFKRTINAPPAEVYRVFTNPTALRDWLADAAQADARKGGRLYLWWTDRYYANCEFTSLEPGKKVAFTWHGKGEPEPTRVQVSITAKEGGSVISVSHGGIGSGKKWGGMAETFRAAWESGLENLQSVLETGFDLRVIRLPRMGILMGDFNAEIAARLAVPAKEGVRLEGVAEGTGAQAAGLQKDDVLVKLGGKRLTNYNSVGPALQGHHGGDRVPVVFYRGSEKKTVTLELSRRPLPEIPPTADALADVAAKKHAELNVEFGKLVEGVTEAEAERKPAPAEWNVKELLAHFVACERDLQSWAAELVNGGNNAGEAADSLEFRPNVTPRLDAIVVRYPALAELLDELQRSQAETLAFLRALPPEFLARKHLYNRLAAWITQDFHLAEHRDQFAAAIEAARK